MYFYWHKQNNLDECYVHKRKKILLPICMDGVQLRKG